MFFRVLLDHYRWIQVLYHVQQKSTASPIQIALGKREAAAPCFLPILPTQPCYCTVIILVRCSSMRLGTSTLAADTSRTGMLRYITCASDRSIACRFNSLASEWQVCCECNTVHHCLCG